MFSLSGLKSAVIPLNRKGISPHICTVTDPDTSSVHYHILVVLVAVPVVVVLEEEVLVCEITSECDGGNSKAGEGTLESIPSRKLACVAPRLTAGFQFQRQRTRVL